MPPYPAAVPGAWSLEAQIYRGFWMVEWFKREFGQREVDRSSVEGVAPESLFDELLRETPPGSMGLMLQPTWSPGVRVPGPEAKGAVIGFGGVHTRAHLYRSIIEGLAFCAARRWRAGRGAGEDAAARAARVGRRGPVAGGRPADGRHLRAADRPAAHPRDVGARCGDRRGGRRSGCTPTSTARRSEMTRVIEVRDPDPARHELYDALYRRVYRRMYDRLKPLYEEIRDITGYPPR